jgi:hypothetical protein
MLALGMQNLRDLHDGQADKTVAAAAAPIRARTHRSRLWRARTGWTPKFSLAEIEKPI